MTRDGKVVEAVRLRAAGVSIRRIGAALDVSPSTVLRWTDPEWAKRSHIAPRVRRRWTRETMIAAIQRFATRYGRPPGAADFNPAMVRAAGHDWRAERFYADADYPTVPSVAREFGSWADAVEAAGFPRPGYGYEHLPTDGGRRGGAHLGAERSAA